MNIRRIFGNNIFKSLIIISKKKPLKYGHKSDGILILGLLSILIMFVALIIPSVLGNGETTPWDWNVTTKLGTTPIRPPDYYISNDNMNVTFNITPSSLIKIERLSLKITGDGVSTREFDLTPNIPLKNKYSGNIIIPLSNLNIPRSVDRLNLEIEASSKGLQQNESHIIEFEVRPPGILEITKFHDRDGNGKKENNEEVLPGWKFNITGVYFGNYNAKVKPTNYNASVETTEDGSVNLELHPGNYVITEEERPGWINITNPTQNVNLVQGHNSSIFFGNIKRAILNIVKFEDENRNGQLDSGETGLANWNFDVKERDTGKKIATKMTDGEGRASIGLPPGNYTITEITDPKWNSSTPVEQSVSLGTGESKKMFFGNYPKDARLSIIKFHDLNRNGQQDPNEPGIPEWRIAISGKDYLGQNYINGVVTDNNGISVPSVLVLRPGIYTVSEETRKDWIPTTPTSQKITLGSDDRRTVSFGNDINDSILQITKLRAINESGKLVLSGGIKGWNFTVSGKDYLNQDYIDNVTTDNNGLWTLKLRPGTYRVIEEMKPNWISITPKEQNATLKPGEFRKLSFTNYLNQILWIYKFNDTNRNGIRDPGEKGVPGWNFSIDDGSDKPITRTTDSNGTIKMSVKPDTKYTVAEYLKLGWQPTTVTQQVNTTNSETPEFSMVFGNAPPSPTITINKFEDANKNGMREADEQGLSGWEFNVIGPENKTSMLSTDENGSVVYICPLPGMYTIKEVKKSGCWISSTSETVKVQIDWAQKVLVEFGNYEICHQAVTNGLMNSDVLVQKFVDPSQLTTNMIGNCNETDLNYTIQIHPREKAEATDLVIAVNAMVPKTPNSQRTVDTAVNGIAGFIDEHAREANPSSKVGIIRWIRNESNEIYPTNNYTDLGNKVMGSQFIQSNDTSAFAYWTYGIIDKFYNVSPETKKILVFITDSESQITEPTEAISANYTVNAIAIGGMETKTTRLLRNLTSAHHGVFSFANNSDELQSALTELAWITKPTNLSGVELIDTLPSYLEPVGYAVNPPAARNVTENNDGRDWRTTTMKWWIGNLSSSGSPWNTSFTARFCWIVPADVHQSDPLPRISQVNYIREDGSRTAISVPEGGISIRKSAPTSRPTPGFETLIFVAGFVMAWQILRIRRV